MTIVRSWGGLVTALIGFLAFAALVLARGPSTGVPQAKIADRVVIAAPVQVLLSGGDRFLAANFETIRAMATADDNPATAAASASFRIRAHRVVAELNPCQEDNYYVANAMLSWGGAPSEGLEVLREAMSCRQWDEFPPFFFGFNQWFFNRDAAEARRALEIAAERARDPQSAATMRRVGIMIEAGEYADDRAALAFLEREREQAADDKLRDMLDKRVMRLQGLIVLREAQAQYEATTGRPLINPQALLDSGVLITVPQDPLRLGYEFVDGRFRLREMKIPGAERRQ